MKVGVKMIVDGQYGLIIVCHVRMWECKLLLRVDGWMICKDAVILCG